MRIRTRRPSTRKRRTRRRRTPASPASTMAASACMARTSRTFARGIAYAVGGTSSAATSPTFAACARSATSTGSLDGGKIEVTLPAEALRGGLVMVDTPGVGSAVARHAVTTLALLPSADALVVLSDADDLPAGPGRIRSRPTFSRRSEGAATAALSVLRLPRRRRSCRRRRWTRAGSRSSRRSPRALRCRRGRRGSPARRTRGPRPGCRSTTTPRL